MHNFKNAFKRARKNAGYKTQKEFAAAYGCSLETVRTWEQGRHTPTLAELDKLCVFFGCSFGYILGETSIRTKDERFRDSCEYTGLSEDSIITLAASTTVRFVVEQLLRQWRQLTKNKQDGFALVSKELYSHSIITLLSEYFKFDFESARRNTVHASFDDGKNNLHATFGADIIERYFLEDIITSIKLLNRDIQKNRAKRME